MNYKVLYRKYRPDSFDNLVGQKSIVEILKNSIIEKKIAHAYIFSGPRGTGKTSTARILAKSINCLSPVDGIACGNCENCLSFNTSPDIIEIDAASNNGVDEIRELINNVKIMPTLLKYKVYIIDEVHMLSQSAFNALLLTLEEPPEHVVFILATTNLENVPITILSRCQKFDFKRIGKKDILDRLKYVCKEENIKYQEDALLEIASLSEGGMRDALGILDQLSKNKQEITLDLVINELGCVSDKNINDLITAIDESNIEVVEKIVNNYRDINMNYKVLIKKLIDYLGKKAIDILKNGQNGNLTYDQYKNLIIDLNDIINKINISVDPYVLIEILLLSYIKTESNIVKEIKEPEIKVDSIKKETEIAVEPVKSQTTETFEKETVKTNDNNEMVNIRINNCFVNASKEYLTNMKDKWNSFINVVSSAKVKGLVTDTTPATASDKYMILVTTIKHKDKELNQEIELIQDSFNGLNNLNYKMIFIDEARWNQEKTKYISNLQNGYHYELLPEEYDKSENEQHMGNIEEIANNIFSLDKIEVK